MKIAIIQLCYVGDIVNVLPLAKHLHDQGHTVDFYVSADYSPVLEGCSYVNIIAMTIGYLNVEGAVNRINKSKYDKILVTQTQGNEKVHWTQKNFTLQSWALAGEEYPALYHELPLVFDRRDKLAEKKLIDAHMPDGDDHRPILAFSLTGKSSKYRHEGEFAKWIHEEFGEDFRIVNIGNGTVAARNPHHLLGLIEKAAVFVGTDSAPLHLSYAVGTPTIAIQPDEEKHRSERRKHWVESVTYSDSITDAGQQRIAAEVRNILGRPSRKTYALSVAIVQLCRYGDILNILPVAHEMALNGTTVDFYVNRDYADVLEAVSYVNVKPVDAINPLVAAKAIDASQYGKILITQVDGNPVPRMQPNFALQSWHQAGEDWPKRYNALPLVFDRRERSEEPQPIGRSPILVFNLDGHSSKYDLAHELRDWIYGKFGADFDIIDLGSAKLKKFHHLLGILEQAAALITIDTSTLHLSYATRTPTIALRRDDPGCAGYQTEPRTHWIASVGYAESRTDAGRKKISNALAEVLKNVANPAAKVWHVFDYFLGNKTDTPRILKAQKTREAMFAADVKYSVRYHRLRDGARTSADLGDTRALPYIKDIIDFGCADPGCKDDDIVLFTNSDVCLVPEAMDELRAKMKDSNCCFSRRVDVADASKTLRLRDLVGKGAHVGADFFAFKVGWWKQHRGELPDVFLACEGWDWICRAWMNQYDPRPEIGPVIYHEQHGSWWARKENIALNPGQKWNRNECERWARMNGCDGALYGNPNSYMFKPDGTWTKRDNAIDPEKFVVIPNSRYVALKADQHLTPMAIERGTIIIEGHLADIPEVKALTAGDVVVDCGAFIGDTMLIFMATGATVIGIEPYPDAAEAARMNCIGATVYEAAAGDGRPLRPSGRECEQNGNFGTRMVGYGGGALSMRVDSLNLKRLTGAKIDVEGSELWVLEGMRNTIQTLRPWLLIELYDVPLKIQGVTRDDILAFLKEMNYSWRVAVGSCEDERCDIMATPN